MRQIRTEQFSILRREVCVRNWNRIQISSYSQNRFAGIIVSRLHRLPENADKCLWKVNFKYELFSKESFHIKKVDAERFCVGDFTKPPREKK